MTRMLTIHHAAQELGVSTKTLRRWEEARFLVPEREPNTNIRFYHPSLIAYWKRLLLINKTWENHLKKLPALREALTKHLAIKPLSPGERIPMLDIEGFTKADDAMEEWTKEYNKIKEEFFSFPRIMQLAISQIEKEKK